MTFNWTQMIATRTTSAIAASAFLCLSVVLPQSVAAQQSPGAVGDPRVDEPNTNTQINDPSRPVNPQNSPLNQPNAAPNRGNTLPNNQMNNRGVGGGAGGMNNVDTTPAPRPNNRLEQFNQPGATDPSRSTEYSPPANSPSRSNPGGRLNDSGVGGGTGGTGTTNTNPGNANPGRDRLNSPTTPTPNRGTNQTPRSQTTPNPVNNTGSDGADSQLNNSTTPNRGVNNTGGGTSNTGGGAGGTGAVQGLW